jgi:hypothetical protein
LLPAVIALVCAVIVAPTADSAPAPSGSRTTSVRASATAMEVIVYVGQLGATSYAQALEAVLQTEDNILATEEQIADMSNRIIYVIQLSQDNSIKVMYLVSSLTQLELQVSSYTYRTVLIPVAVLPAGWCVGDATSQVTAL